MLIWSAWVSSLTVTSDKLRCPTVTCMLDEEEELTASEANYAQGEYRLTIRVRYGGMFLFIFFLCDASTIHWNLFPLWARGVQCVEAPASRRVHCVESPAFFDSDRYVTSKARVKHASSDWQLLATQSNTCISIDLFSCIQPNKICYSYILAVLQTNGQYDIQCSILVHVTISFYTSLSCHKHIGM